MTATDRPLVSIVTPSFNQAPFIAETMTSVLAQDYPRIEYLVIDGGSTDGTVDILRSFGDRVRWLSEHDRGQSHAINKGWRMARGQIIAWLNSDDVYRPGAISAVVNFFARHPTVGLVYGDCDFIDTQGKIVGRHRLRPATGVDLLRSPVSIIAQPAAFLRRDVMHRVGYLDESLHYVMDVEYWIRVAAYHDIAYLPARLAAFRVHERSKSVGQAARLDRERVRLYERLFASDALPDRLQRVEREAMSNAYCRAANFHFAAGDMAQARRYAVAAWLRQPWRLHRSQLKILALGAFGTRGAHVAAWLRERLT